MGTGGLLGPSFLGIIAPSLQNFLFPTVLNLNPNGTTVSHPSMNILLGLSQLGLVLYMFSIGIKFNTNLLSKHWKVAGTISLAGVFSPLVIGGVLGLALANNSQLYPTNIAPWQAALFMGSAMLITAFPMLARIIHESGISNSKLGTLALSGAAFDDAVAWILLAVVLATVKGSPAVAMLTIGGGILYTLGMLFVSKPLLNRFILSQSSRPSFRQQALTGLLIVLMLCAWLTDAIGIYSIFGAFIAGVVMPRCNLLEEIQQKIESLTVAILLPIFFVYSGLNTQLSVVLQPSLLFITMIVILLAFLCKGGACFVGARLSGLSWNESGIIGGLMSARGLVVQKTLRKVKVLENSHFGKFNTSSYRISFLERGKSRRGIRAWQTWKRWQRKPLVAKPIDITQSDLQKA
jgi:Kef-type K+ transport system membrane component KefB